MKPLRFTVTDGTGHHHAATWRLWPQISQHGQEIYLTCRELGGVIHTSFHHTGDWHTAFAYKALDTLVDDQARPTFRRYIEKWDRPSEIKPGITLAYKILTPWSVVTTPITNHTPDKLIEIPNASPGHANETMVLICGAGLSLELRNCVLVGETDLLHGGKVVVVNHQIAMPTVNLPTRTQAQFFRNRSKADLADANLRALVFLDDQYGNKMILDAVVTVH